MHDPDERVPLFVFAAEPHAQPVHRTRPQPPARSSRCRARPIGSAPSEIDEALRQQLATLNVNEAETALHGLAEGSAGRVERDLAAIGRLAADGAVETLWFDFTTSVNGTLDRESGAIEFATGNGEGETLHDGTHAGDLLPQLALLVISKGGKVVTVRSDDLDGDGVVGTGDGRAPVRAGLSGRPAGGPRRRSRRRSDAPARLPVRSGAHPGRARRRIVNPSRQPKRITTSSARGVLDDRLDVGLGDDARSRPSAGVLAQLEPEAVGVRDDAGVRGDEPSCQPRGGAEAGAGHADEPAVRGLDGDGPEVERGEVAVVGDSHASDATGPARDGVVSASAEIGATADRVADSRARRRVRPRLEPMRFGMFVPQGWRHDLVGIEPAEHWEAMRGLAEYADAPDSRGSRSGSTTTSTPCPSPSADRGDARGVDA